MSDIEWTAVDITDHVQRGKLDGGELFVEKSAYLAVKQELDIAKSARRCAECGNVGMHNHGLVMQDTINKLQQELEAARAIGDRWFNEYQKVLDVKDELVGKLADANAQIAEITMVATALLESSDCRGDEDCDHCVAEQNLNKWSGK